ncbi:hypothetical protein LIER_04456 [Lithospermum erythrorhizon]|uniref:Uncharacterized protein n=1 Tax=Lithospermum erythrorhizon TaxID=34254 RepID=A0AAV3NYN7_LITER
MVDDKVAYMAFFKGLRYGKLKKPLLVRTPLTKDELTAMITTHIELEELKVGVDQPTDLRETVMKKEGNVSPKKLPVWERFQNLQMCQIHLLSHLLKTPHEVISEDVGQKKKSKKRKHKKSADDGESFVPKKTLSKEERAAKKSRKAEMRARRVAQKAADTEAAEDDVPEEVEEFVPKEVRPSVIQPYVDDEWLPEHEPHGDNADEKAQESDDEDIAAVITKRRKVTRKLNLNENKTRVENKRVPKNVVTVSTANVALNYEEEQAKWRLMDLENHKNLLKYLNGWYTLMGRETAKVPKQES